MFTDAIWAGSANTSGLRIPRYSQCSIAIDTQLVANNNAIESVCGTSKPTVANAGASLANARMRDSNGVLNGQWLAVDVDTYADSGAVSTGRSGQNDHSFDFGFAEARSMPGGPSHAVPLLPLPLQIALLGLVLLIARRRLRFKN